MRILSIFLLAIAATSAGSLVFVAMPLIASEWSISAPELSGLLLARFSIGALVGMLVGIFLPRLFGAAGALILPALLGVASVLCGLAETAEMLGRFRFAAGLFAGALSTYCVVVTALAYSRQQRAIFLGLLLALTAAVGAFGPFLAAQLTDAYGWRWTLHATAILCAVAMAAVVASWQAWKSASLRSDDDEPAQPNWGRQGRPD